MNKNLGVPLALPLPLLTLEGCPKDGVVSPPSASLTLIVSQASQLALYQASQLALYLLTTKNYLKNI